MSAANGYIRTCATVTAVKAVEGLKLATASLDARQSDATLYLRTVTLKYTVNGSEYEVKKHLNSAAPTPLVGQSVSIVCLRDKPCVCRILSKKCQSGADKT